MFAVEWLPGRHDDLQYLSHGFESLRKACLTRVELAVEEVLVVVVVVDVVEVDITMPLLS